MQIVAKCFKFIQRNIKYSLPLFLLHTQRHSETHIHIFNAIFLLFGSCFYIIFHLELTKMFKWMYKFHEIMINLEQWINFDQKENKKPKQYVTLHYSEEMKWKRNTLLAIQYCAFDTTRVIRHTMAIYIYMYSSDVWDEVWVSAKCLFDCIILFEISETKCDKRMSHIYNNQTTLIYYLAACLVLYTFIGQNVVFNLNEKSLLSAIVIWTFWKQNHVWTRIF